MLIKRKKHIILRIVLKNQKGKKMIKNKTAKTLITAFALSAAISGCSMMPQAEDATPAMPKSKSEDIQKQEKAKPKRIPYKGRTYIV